MREYRVEFCSVSSEGRITPRSLEEADAVRSVQGTRAKIFAVAPASPLLRSCLELGRGLSPLDIMTLIAFHALCQREIAFDQIGLGVQIIGLPAYRLTPS